MKSIKDEIELLKGQDQKPDIIIVNHELSPIQQRNLEKEWHTKVIDRTGLILEIFGARAQTKEGIIQVNLASLEYQKSRLVRSWTHLERQRGGAGFMGGPGERQLEIDRRLIDQKITKLKNDLKTVKRTRSLGKDNREKVPFPVIALVGYTNAGKSTLFNALTKADVLAQDLLFATLDPTMRKITLPDKQDVILSDTVGFISDLPTHLILAFRATLEHILEADIIAHVIDASSDQYERQKADVESVLEDLGLNIQTDDRIIEIYNKIDITSQDQSEDITRLCKINQNKVMISALNKDNIQEGFLEKCSKILAKNINRISIDIPVSDGSAMAWLYENGHIIERQEKISDKDQKNVINLLLEISHIQLMRFRKKYGYEHYKD